ncbi:uncharacterized protein LOC134820693 [Bolinopsis microptera]|uniref:uncharacterized protein LOC134820693 n=1 Tax=Bolinopsis microptera TaxID=2820187 RepID=UPI00307AF0D9
MPESLVTVLAVEGDVYYNACNVCSSKVELVPASNRGWCRKCRACTHPNRRYRLSLKISEHSAPFLITLFGSRADNLFGCTAPNFFRTVQELNLSNTQILRSVQRALLSEVVKVARNAEGGITGAVFAVENKRIVDHVRQLDLTTGTNFSPVPLRIPADRLEISSPSNSNNRHHDKSLLVHNSTPLFSQLSLEDLGENLGSLSPVVSDFNISSTTHNSRRYPENECSKHGNSNHDNSSNHGNHYNPSNNLRRGKRMRCRVQNIVHIPLTQNDSLHENIRPPDCDTSVKETHLLKTETSSDSDVILELMKSDDFSLFEDKENVPVISDFIGVQKDDVQKDDVQKDDFSLFEETENMLSVSDCKERNMSCNLTNSQDFDSFDVGSISAALPTLPLPTNSVTTSPLCSDDDLFANSPGTKEEPALSEHDWSNFSAMSECNTSTKSNVVPMVTGVLSEQDEDVSNCSVELF